MLNKKNMNYVSWYLFEIIQKLGVYIQIMYALIIHIYIYHKKKETNSIWFWGQLSSYTLFHNQ